MSEQKELRHCDFCNRDLIEHEVELSYNEEAKKEGKEWICKDCLRENLYNKYEFLEQQKHISADSGLIVENYPYGWKKTKIRYWIESNKGINKGDRFGSQTLNPNTLKWNAPKYGTYSPLLILTREKATGYIRCIHGLSSSIGYVEDIRRLNELIKRIKLNSIQEENIRIMKAYTKAYENVSFEINPVYYKNIETGEIVKQIPLFEISKYEKLTNEEEDKRQIEIKQDIQKAVGYYYENGVTA